jgi:short subunit dehydrogenase-like uncharacterized protein
VSSRETRPYDLTVLGATGFTGRLVVEYLARATHDSELRLAVAGRNEKKLRTICEKLQNEKGVLGDVGIETCDIHDPDSLARLAAKTRVLISTVGPYMRYGEPVVKACLSEQTDYIDITGEADFVARIIKKYDEEAQAKNVLIISCCGFDSIPADLGTLFTVSLLPPDETKTVRSFVEAKMEPSGGTWASLIQAMSPESHAKAGVGALALMAKGFHREPTIGGWAFPMPVIDPWIVRRSARKRGDYGPKFRYHQFFMLSSLRSVFKVGTALGGMVLLSQFSRSRQWLLDRKRSGTGPSKQVRSKSWFKLTFVGTSATARIRTSVSGGDPGYTETAKMVSEAALTLLTSRYALPFQGGVLTPGAALGERLITRLVDAGIAFTVDEATAIH